MVARPGHNDVKHRTGACGASFPKQFDKRSALFERRHKEISPYVKHLALLDKLGRDVLGRHHGICAGGVDKPPIFAFDVDDQRGRRGDARQHAYAAHVDAAVLERLDRELPEYIVSHTPGHSDLYSQPRQIHRDVCGVSPDRQRQLVGHNQLALCGTRRDRRSQVIDNQDSGARQSSIRDFFYMEGLCNDKTPLKSHTACS